MTQTKRVRYQITLDILQTLFETGLPSDAALLADGSKLTIVVVLADEDIAADRDVLEFLNFEPTNIGSYQWKG